MMAKGGKVLLFGLLGAGLLGGIALASKKSDTTPPPDCTSDRPCGINDRGTQVCQDGEYLPCQDPDVCMDGESDSNTIGSCGPTGGGNLTEDITCVNGQWETGEPYCVDNCFYSIENPRVYGCDGASYGERVYDDPLPYNSLTDCYGYFSESTRVNGTNSSIVYRINGVVYRIFTRTDSCNQGTIIVRVDGSQLSPGMNTLRASWEEDGVEMAYYEWSLVRNF